MLTVSQIRKVLDTLYDGEPQTTFWIFQIRSFYAKKDDRTREFAVYLWLIRNGITGRRLVEFFEMHNRSFLNGLNTIINRMEGRRYSSEAITIQEAL